MYQVCKSLVLLAGWFNGLFNGSAGSQFGPSLVGLIVNRYQMVNLNTMRMGGVEEVNF